jgi:hypothetical protein
MHTIVFIPIQKTYSIIKLKKKQQYSTNKNPIKEEENIHFKKFVKVLQ